MNPPAGLETLASIEALAAADPRYRVQAYLWVLRVTDYACRRLKRPRHITARELLEGHRALGLREFGPMAYEVFRYWGLGSSEDVGRIVFSLVESGRLSKTPEDRLENFRGGYDFHEVFVTRYPW
jgi:uncharacterized repeat protein (TIGR04138 family)